MRIYLLGYMGAGKSHLGKILAERLGYSFVDTDAMVEATTGKSIRQFFEEQGEGAFRIAEQKALHATGQQTNLVVATGGGLPTFADNLAWMNSNGMTVYFAGFARYLISSTRTRTGASTTPGRHRRDRPNGNHSPPPDRTVAVLSTSPIGDRPGASQRR